MPISDEFAEKLLDEMKALREENTALVEILLKQGQILPLEQAVQIPEEMESIGKIPWYRRKSLLESKFRKPKLSEISGISDTEELA